MKEGGVLFHVSLYRILLYTVRKVLADFAVFCYRKALCYVKFSQIQGNGR